MIEKQKFNWDRDMSDIEVVIYKPAKTSMQSGQAKTQYWQLEFKQYNAKNNDALMGWVGGAETTTQLKLKFENLEDAIKYAESKDYKYIVRQPKRRALKPKSYSANFAYHKKESWTH